MSIRDEVIVKHNEQVEKYETACQNIMKGCLNGSNEPATLASLQSIMSYADSLQSQLAHYRQLLNDFPGFNSISHSPDKAVQWVIRIDNLMESTPPIESKNKL